jgi:DNA-binding MarR family transcriptional regulator
VKSNLNKKTTLFVLIGFLIVLVEIVVTFFLLNYADSPINAVMAFLISQFFYFIVILTLNNSRSLTNIFFSLSPFIMGLSTSIGLLGYLDILFESLWIISSALIIISPLGIYFSSQIIIHGKNDWLTGETILMTVFVLFISLISILIYEPNPNIQNVYFSDIPGIILLTAIVYNFIKIREVTIEIKEKLNFIIIGFTVIIISLVINLALLFALNSSTIVRLIGSLMGLSILIFAFFNVSKDVPVSPQKTSKNKLFDFLDSIEEAVKTAQRSLSSQTPETNFLPLSANTETEYKRFLIEEMNGLSLMILIEVTKAFPDSLTNTQLQKILRKSKSTLNAQIKKLSVFGFLRRIINVIDTRTKPIIITNDGLAFLKYIHVELSKYLDKEDSSSLIAQKISELSAFEN